MSRLLEIAITLVLAVLTAGMQTVMKGLSRTDLPGKKHGLEREDLLFWTDWTMAGAVTLCGSILVASLQDKPIPPGRVALAIAGLLVGCSLFPLVLRVFAYDPGARIKVWGWKGLGWVIIANIVGALILLSAVAAGVNVYGWGT